MPLGVSFLNDLQLASSALSLRARGGFHWYVRSGGFSEPSTSRPCTSPSRGRRHVIQMRSGQSTAPVGCWIV